MDTSILEVILKDAYTLHQVRVRVRTLKRFLTEKLFASTPAGADLESDLEKPWLKTLPEDFIAKFSQDNFTRMFEEIDLALKKMDILVVYVPVEFPPAEIARIGTWVKNNLTQIKLVDVKINPDLLAGAALVHNGIYRDFSLRAKIEDQKEEIIENFRRMLRK